MHCHPERSAAEPRDSLNNILGQKGKSSLVYIIFNAHLNSCFFPLFLYKGFLVASLLKNDIPASLTLGFPCNSLTPASLTLGFPCNSLTPASLTLGFPLSIFCIKWRGGGAGGEIVARDSDQGVVSKFTYRIN